MFIGDFLFMNKSIESAKEIPMGHFNKLFYFGSFIVRTPFMEFKITLKKNADEEAYKALVKHWRTILVVQTCPTCKREVFALDLLDKNDCQFCTEKS